MLASVWIARKGKDATSNRGIKTLNLGQGLFKLPIYLISPYVRIMTQYCCQCLPNRSQNFIAPCINNLTNYDIERVRDIKRGKIEIYHSFLRFKFYDPKISNRRCRCWRGLRLVFAAFRVLGLRVRIPSEGMDVRLLWVLCVVR